MSATLRQEKIESDAETGHCQTNLNGRAQGAGLRRSGRQLVRVGVAEGQRNSTIASLTGHLLWHGVDPDVALELPLAWNRMRCRPPFADAKVAQVVASIVRLHNAEGQIEQDRFDPR